MIIRICGPIEIHLEFGIYRKRVEPILHHLLHKEIKVNHEVIRHFVGAVLAQETTVAPVAAVVVD